MNRNLVLAVLAAGCLVLAACATRPTQGELAESILEATESDPDVQLTEDRARCIANALLGSDLSDTTLSGLANDFSSPEVLETEVNDLEELVTAAAQAC